MSSSWSPGRGARLVAMLALAVPAAGIAADAAPPPPPVPGAGLPAPTRPAAAGPSAPPAAEARVASPAAVARPDPADPTIAVPPARHDAPLAGYTPMREDRSGWREVNDGVRAAGGHIGIMRDEMRRRQDATRPAAPKEAR